MNPVLVAHGTRKACGVTMIGDLAERVGAALGFPVRTDIPAHVTASGHRDVIVTEPLGPSGQMVRAMTDRMLNPVGGLLIPWSWRERGSSDASARADLRTTAALLSPAIGQHVEPAFPATGEPSVAYAVADLRSRGARRVVVTSYLLADGLFQDRLPACGADVVTEPLGTHPGVLRLIASRFRRARLPLAA